MPLSEDIKSDEIKKRVPSLPRNGDGHPHVDSAAPLPVRRSSRTLGVWFIFVIVLGFVGAVKLFIHERKPPAAAHSTPPPVITVGTRKAVYEQIPRHLAVTGSITAWDQLNIGAEPNGLRIDEVNVEEGDTVHKGRVLAVLDSSVLRAQRRMAEARLASARATIPKAVQPNRPQDIAGLESALLQAQANARQQHANLVQAQAHLDNAIKNHKRYQKLLADGYVTTKEMEDRQTELDRNRALVLAAQDAERAARFAVEQARQRLDLARTGGRTEDVSIARASSEEIEANIQQLDALIDQTVIRAPDDGLIVKRDAHIGDITGGNKVLFTMVRRNQLELRAQLPEADLARVKVGQRVRLTATRMARPGPERPRSQEPGEKTLYGRIWLIAPTVDAQTRLGVARIAIPTNAGLMPGMFVRAQIDGGHDQALVIPAQAVLGSAEERYVFVLEGDRVRRRTVTTGDTSRDVVQIVSGVKAGEDVVTEGGGFLTDGDTVRTATPTDASSGVVNQPAKVDDQSGKR